MRDTEQANGVWCGESGEQSSLRRRGITFAPVDGAPQPAYPVDDPRQPVEKVAKTYKLRKPQQLLLLRVLALQHHLHEVRRLVREEDPTFPDLSDTMLRYYRRKANTRSVAVAEEALEEALHAGLANKARRLAELNKLYDRYEERVCNLERIINLRARRNIYDPFLPGMLARLDAVDGPQIGVLRQIMQETANMG